MFRLHVVLVKPDADVLRIDLHEFGERVLQAAANTDGAASSRIQIRELFAGHGARGVVASPGLDHNHIGQIERGIGKPFEADLRRGWRRRRGYDTGTRGDRFTGRGMRAGRFHARRFGWRNVNVRSEGHSAGRHHGIGVERAVGGRCRVSVGVRGRSCGLLRCRGNGGSRFRMDRRFRGTHTRRRIEPPMLEFADEVGDELLRLAAAGAVADGHDRKLILADELFELALRVQRILALAVRVDHGVFEELTGLVEHGELAPGTDARIDGEDALPAQRRLKQEAAEVPREDHHRVVLRPFGEFATNLPFEAGQHEPFE